MIYLEVVTTGHTTAIAANTAAIATLQSEVTALKLKLDVDELASEVVEKAAGEIATEITKQVSKSWLSKTWDFCKKYIMPVLTTLTTATSSSAIITAERLFQVLTIDNPGLDGLYYIEIS